MTFSMRRITESADPALSDFGRIQNAIYYAPELLIPAEYFGVMLQDQRPERRNIIFVAENRGEVIGGTLFHLLSNDAGGGAAFSSFIGIAQAARGSGAARALHQARLQMTAEAGLAGVFADAVHVSALSAEALAAEARVGSDPTLRRVKLGALGFSTVDAPYWQPVGGPNGGPLMDLDLLYCPLTPADDVPLRLITQTLQLYWQSWLGPQRAQHEAEALAKRTKQDPVALLPAVHRPTAFR